MSQQDWMLMHRVAAGDEEAVGELYDRFGPLIYKVAWQFHPSHAEAEDAVQEIFVRLWKTADRFDPRRAKLVTWVMLIARRHLIDRLRRSSVRPSLIPLEGEPPPSGPDPDPGAPAQTTEFNTRIRKRLDELPELQRTVIERAYLQGYTLREISEQLEAPLGTIKSALSRGLARLRERAASDRAI
ncbi:MAG: sigma-70 family RNA polymerase sigma factor [Phycisphaerales bacterium]|nr:sigma-70 family RNA polymerase sigma factor [Phycisphaerae bacterium]NNF42559.1 sigma-70 family RNA polymerase sigma factor [Phycisphaerales bacterium]NNM26457.1 sigma-70 family RNA polymerase sigma factor [Phycisphaerales bacterium]